MLPPTRVMELNVVSVRLAIPVALPSDIPPRLLPSTVKVSMPSPKTAKPPGPLETTTPCSRLLLASVTVWAAPAVVVSVGVPLVGFVIWPLVIPVSRKLPGAPPPTVIVSPALKE